MSVFVVSLTPFMVGSFLGGLFGWLMALLSIFLILLILVQRGRGGGLTGALGGPGGQSAFGSKAGDMFTRITFATAGVWILMCALAMWSLGNARNAVATPEAPPTMRATGTEPELPGEAAEPTGSTSGLSIPSGLDSLDSITNPPATDSTETPAAEITADEFPAGEGDDKAGATPAEEGTPAVETTTGDDTTSAGDDTP